jgi:hypothetical protein
MRDDLFQFLADQEEGGRLGSAALAPSRPNAASKCGRSSTGSKLASVPSASSRNPAMSHYDVGLVASLYMEFLRIA